MAISLPNGNPSWPGTLWIKGIKFRYRPNEFTCWQIKSILARATIPSYFFNLRIHLKAQL